MTWTFTSDLDEGLIAIQLDPTQNENETQVLNPTTPDSSKSEDFKIHFCPFFSCREMFQCLHRNTLKLIEKSGTKSKLDT